MSRAAHCGPPARVRPWLRVADHRPDLDPRAPDPRGPASEMDLVGVLGLPELLRQAQGLCLRRDPLLGHVPLDSESDPECPQRDSNPRYGLERAATWTASRWGQSSPRLDEHLPASSRAASTVLVLRRAVAAAPVLPPDPLQVVHLEHEERDDPEEDMGLRHAAHGRGDPPRGQWAGRPKWAARWSHSVRLRLPAAPARPPDSACEEADEPDQGDDRSHDEKPMDHEPHPKGDEREDCQHE